MVIYRVKLIDQLVGHNGRECSPSLPSCLSEDPECARIFARVLVSEGGGTLHQDINAGEPHCARQEDLFAARV